MSYSVNPASALGRLGEGFGKGLSEQIPKEAERYRLASGLKNLEQQQGLNPFQQFSRLASMPGITPQMLQSGSELLRQQGMLQGLGNNGGQQPRPTFSDIQKEPLPIESKQSTKSITTPEGVKANIEPYIPMTTQEKQQLAGKLNKQNPKLYPDYDTAIAAAEKIDQENQNINIAEQNKNQKRQAVQTKVQDELKDRLNTLGGKLGVNLPGNVFSDIEDKAIAEILENKKSEKEIAADAGKELDKIMRQYADVKAVGDNLLGRGRESASTFKRLQKEFEKRQDTKNLAELMQAENGISPMLSYSLAQPISKHEDISKHLKSLPKLNKIETIAETVYPDSIKKTEEIVPKLAKKLTGTDASPLAIAYELKKKGYDPTTWLDYLNEHQKKLDLRQSQIDQLNKQTDFFIGPLNDIWLSEWTGLGE